MSRCWAINLRWFTDVITACSNRYPNGVEPLVYSKPSGPEALFLFDGSGSWGSGAEAAAWFREQIAGKFRNPDEISPNSVNQTLTDLIPTLPKQIAEEDWSFSLAVVIIERTAIHVGALGSISVLALRGNSLMRLYSPVRLVDELVSSGRITVAEAETHQFRRMISSTFFGAEGACLNWSEASLLDDKIILGDAALPRFLELQAVPFNFDDVNELRDDVERYGGTSSPTGIIDVGFCNR